MIKRYLAPLLIGEDASRIDDQAQKLNKVNRGRLLPRPASRWRSGTLSERASGDRFTSF